MPDPTRNTGYIVRGKLPQGARIEGHQIQPITAPDKEQLPPAEVMARAFALMQRHMYEINKKAVDETQVFDMYLTQTLMAESELSITLQPSYEFTERIESVIITGPAGACTLQLGDREWSLVIPASGIIVIAPVAIYLGRNDTRMLTGSSSGNYALELMGHADRRWST